MEKTKIDRIGSTWNPEKARMLARNKIRRPIRQNIYGKIKERGAFSAFPIPQPLIIISQARYDCKGKLGKWQNRVKKPRKGTFLLKSS